MTEQPIVQPTCYRVSLLSEDDANARYFAIEVRYRGEDHWVVVQGDDWAFLAADGRWTDAVELYGRGDDWLAGHLFDLKTALRLAREAAPLVTVNGITAQQTLAMRSTR